MNHWLFLYRIKDKKVLRAIAEAEAHTSGEIRVFVSHKVCADPLAAAQEQFELLGMRQTQNRNAVLIYVAPKSRNFAIYGDEGVHEKCGDTFWGEVAAAMTALFQQGRLTKAVVGAVERTGKLLAQHFPPDEDGGDRNELPDEVARD